MASEASLRWHSVLDQPIQTPDAARRRGAEEAAWQQRGKRLPAPGSPSQRRHYSRTAQLRSEAAAEPAAATALTETASSASSVSSVGTPRSAAAPWALDGDESATLTLSPAPRSPGRPHHRVEAADVRPGGVANGSNVYVFAPTAEGRHSPSGPRPHTVLMEASEPSLSKRRGLQSPEREAELSRWGGGGGRRSPSPRRAAALDASDASWLRSIDASVLDRARGVAESMRAPSVMSDGGGGDHDGSVFSPRSPIRDESSWRSASPAARSDGGGSSSSASSSPSASPRRRLGRGRGGMEGLFSPVSDVQRHTARWMRAAEADAD